MVSQYRFSLMMSFHRTYFSKVKNQTKCCKVTYFGFTTIVVGFYLIFDWYSSITFAEHGPDIMAYYSHPLF